MSRRQDSLHPIHTQPEEKVEDISNGGTSRVIYQMELLQPKQKIKMNLTCVGSSVSLSIKRFEIVYVRTFTHPSCGLPE